MTNKFLGEGWESAVIKNENNTISKFGFKKSLTDEFIKICKFQRRNKTILNSYSDYTNIRLIELKDKSRIPKESIIFNKMIESVENYRFNYESRNYAHENIKNFININSFDSSIYELILPYVKGKSIDQIRRVIFREYDTFKIGNYKINNTIYTEVCVLPKIFRERLVYLLIKLLENVKIMNNEGIFHNDLHPGNIIINDDNIKIIDFGYLTFDEPLIEIFGKPIVNDKTKILEVIKLLLLCEENL